MWLEILKQAQENKNGQWILNQVWCRTDQQALALLRWQSNFKTLPMAQRTRGLSSCCQCLNKFKHKSPSNFIFRISTKHELQNPNETSASRLKIKFKILDKASFRIKISIKIQLHNLYKTSVAKYWPNSSLKILPELRLQNIDQTLYSKSEQKFSFMTIPQLPNLQQTVANMIHITNISKSNNPNKFWIGIFTRQGHINQVEKTCCTLAAAVGIIHLFLMCSSASSAAFTASQVSGFSFRFRFFQPKKAFNCCCDINSTKQESVRELGSESVSDKHSQWSDSGPIKMKKYFFISF